ncbi:energy transducer TonB [Parvibaculum sp. MBR-TMA-1.3b-4.2]
MSSLDFREGHPGSSRVVGLAIVLGLHVVLLAALVFGLGSKDEEEAQVPLQVTLLEEESAPEPPAPETPPPPPDLAPPEPAYIPPPEIKLETPPPAPKAIQAVQETKPEPQPVKRQQKPAVTGPRADPSHGNTQPPYPAASRRMGEEGRVVLELYVDETGDVTKGRIAQSSGFPRLDKTALIHAKRKWHFLPAMQNGKPVGHWIKFAVAFKLTD